MRPNNIFELVCFALPKNIDRNKFITSVPESLISDSPQLAAMTALKICKGLDWNTYIKANPDVGSKNINPIIHFVKHGVLESRSLFCKTDYQCYIEEKNTYGQFPEISIIIPNFNKSIFIEKGIKSLLAQTLKDIELIIVDDCSTDNSREIVEKLASCDERIKLIKNQDNLSQHMAKKIGVDAARGKYIMFMDPDDFYASNACEIALKYATQGYEIVSFNMHILNNGTFSKGEMAGIDKNFNNPINRYYKQSEIIDKVFVDRELGFTMVNKIFASTLCKEGFNLLEDGDYRIGEDLYAFLAIVSLARGILKVTDRLYYYHYGIGISTIKASAHQPQKLSDSRHLQIGKVWPAIERLCQAKNLASHIEKIRARLINGTFLTTLESLPYCKITEFYNCLKNYYGILPLVVEIMKINFTNWLRIASSFKYYLPEKESAPKNNRKRKLTIAIFYHTISFGGAEKNIVNMCNAFVSFGFNVILILEIKTEYDFDLNPEIKLVYIRGGKYEIINVENHLRDIYELINLNQIDLVFYLSFFSRTLLWDLMLFKLSGIPVITSLRTDYNWGLSGLWHKYDHESQLAVNRCADKVICLSTYSELYLRTMKIDAVYIPNMFNIPSLKVNWHSCNNRIAVVGRLGEPSKNISECLLILKILASYVADIKMIFIGGFATEYAREIFMKKVNELNLGNYVEITGWTSNPQSFLLSCKALLSTSYREGFPNAIAEAQALGLPCVIYNLAIMLNKNNEGIISVAQNERKKAAEELLVLLTNQEQWEYRSVIARNNMNNYSEALFKENYYKLINTFNISSELREYSDMEYDTVIRNISYCAYNKL